MLKWLIGLLTPALVSGVIDAYKARLAADNVTDRIAADLAAKEIEAEIAARREASATIIAEQGRWYTACIRPLFAAPFIIFAWKVVVWDKVLAFGHHRRARRRGRRLGRPGAGRLFRRPQHREGCADPQAVMDDLSCAGLTRASIDLREADGLHRNSGLPEFRTS